MSEVCVYSERFSDQPLVFQARDLVANATQFSWYFISILRGVACLVLCNKRSCQEAKQTPNLTEPFIKLKTEKIASILQN